MNTKEKTLEQLLEEEEARFPNAIALYQWSTNYEVGQTPFSLFLDLIGYSQEELGVCLYDLNKPLLGYLELDLLGDALREYANKGEDAYNFVVSLIEAEGRE